ncbi:MAG: M6 family metalloprotease domain-containing protein [Prevotella sp.]|nr:M6 family metalloprotease domain-containing protein [Prevotella sp.]
MNRLIFSFVVAILATITVHAAKALSESVAVLQPDGTTLFVTLYGDEHVSWMTTNDGMLVVEKGGAYYVAAINDQGELWPTTHLAHQKEMRNAEEQQACEIQLQRRSLFFEKADCTLQAIRRAQVTDANYFPHQGNPKCLVLLVNFADNQFTSTNPKAQFEQYFNGETQENLGQNEDKNLVSVQRYFELSSHGKFIPEFDVVGPFTLPQTLDYYGANQGGSGQDANFSQFCRDAIAAADGTIDFRQYDNNGDGKAELVCVIYAGYGESVSGNPANTLWPKCGMQNVSTKDGVTVTYMNCSPELFRVSNGTDINGIGLFVHEFSHGMGLSDHYATVTSAQKNNQSPEFWDLMDYGEYANNGYAPVPYTAWEQSVMGWTEIEELEESQNGIELTPLMKGGKAYKFSNGADDEEWMILENVQARDTENRIPGFVYGHGLLVWHIAYNKGTVAMSDFPNNVAGQPRVTVVPADGLIINGYQFGDNKPYTQAEYTASLGGDPFPGANAITTLAANMELPNYIFYSGDPTPAFKLKNIAEDTTTGLVIFDFDNGTPASISNLTSVFSDGEEALYDLQGRRLTNKSIQRGIYIKNGKKIMVR